MGAQTSKARKRSASKDDEDQLETNTNIVRVPISRSTKKTTGCPTCHSGDKRQRLRRNATPLTDKPDQESEATRPAKMCAFCRKFSPDIILSEIVVAPGERLNCCIPCFAKNHNTICIIQRKLQTSSPVFKGSGGSDTKNIPLQESLLKPSVHNLTPAAQLEKLEKRLLDFEVVNEQRHLTAEKRTDMISFSLHQLQRKVVIFMETEKALTQPPAEPLVKNVDHEKIRDEVRSINVKLFVTDAKMTTTNTKYDQLEIACQAANEIISEMGRKNLSSQSKLSSLNEQASKTAKKLAQLDDMLQQHGEQIKPLKNEFEAFRETTRRMGEKINSWQSSLYQVINTTNQVEKQLPVILDQVHSTESKLEMLDSRLNTRSVKVAEVTGKLADFEVWYTSINAKLATFEETYLSLRRFAEVEHSMAIKVQQLEEKLAAPLEKVIGMKEKLETVTAAVRAMDGKYPTAEDIISVFGKRFTPVKESLIAIDKRLILLETGEQWKTASGGTTSGRKVAVAESNASDSSGSSEPDTQLTNVNHARTQKTIQKGPLAATKSFSVPACKINQAPDCRSSHVLGKRLDTNTKPVSNSDSGFGSFKIAETEQVNHQSKEELSVASGMPNKHPRSYSDFVALDNGDNNIQHSPQKGYLSHAVKRSAADVFKGHSRLLDPASLDFGREKKESVVEQGTILVKKPAAIQPERLRYGAASGEIFNNDQIFSPSSKEIE